MVLGRGRIRRPQNGMEGPRRDGERFWLQNSQAPYRKSQQGPSLIQAAKGRVPPVALRPHHLKFYKAAVKLFRHGTFFLHKQARSMKSICTQVWGKRGQISHDPKKLPVQSFRLYFQLALESGIKHAKFFLESQRRK